MQWLAGMTVTADRLNDFSELSDSTTTGATAATGWSLTTFSGRRKSGITTVNVFVTRTGVKVPESAAGTGRITPQVLVATLPTDWCPPETLVVIASNGMNSGDIAITPTGTCTLRSVTGSAGFDISQPMRFAATWIND